MFQHFIITAFSYRGYTKDINWRDPLNKKNLEHRFQLFQLSCLPSMLNQVEQDFTWILIVDPDLPNEYRERLRKLISGRSNSFLHNFDKVTDLGSLLWLKPYINKNAEFIITTKLDDDDAIFTSFTEYVKKHVEKLGKTSSTPYMKFFGCKDVVQWDYFWSKHSPLGYTKPWTRANSIPVSAGFSILCKHPEFDFSVLHFCHSLFEPLKHYKPEIQNLASPIDERVNAFYDEIIISAKSSNTDWNGILSPSENFHYLKTNYLQVVMVNHLNNIMYARMFEGNKFRKAVNIDDSFPGMAIDFAYASVNIRKHRKSVLLLVEMAIRALLYLPENVQKQGQWLKIKNRYMVLKRTIKGVINMR
ncbi:MAG: glycosyltransferase [Bacteroidota bacterium]|nr:glycosyltransferase [Bacteroidota bacterium]